MRSRSLIVGSVLVLAGTLGACGSDADTSGSARFPDVVAAVAEEETDGVWSFDVTISSPYDSPERFADAWRILSSDGRVLGVRELTHHHAGEQPFTRSLRGVEIPASITMVTIEGRDLLHGWGGRTFELRLGG